METRQTNKRPVEIDYDVEDEDQYYVTTRPHTSARRYNLPPKRDTLEDPTTETGAVIQRRRSVVTPTAGSSVTSKAIGPTIKGSARRIRRFPLLAVILGMVVMALLAFTFSALGAWWQLHQDDSTYGRPRTYQTDAVVGHNDSASSPSHFIFINLNRHVIIIEMPGGDTTHARIYNGPTLFGDGQDLTPVTGEFRDVNGDGKPDMIVHIQDQRIVYINDGTQFRPLQPGEQVSI
jgi:hypothetical protein